MKKRIVALSLILVLLISSLPLVSATGDNNLGTEDNPIIISDFDDFKSFLENPNTDSQVKYYSLNADITAPEGVTVGGSDLSNVIFEGNHYNIYNLNINEALFDKVSDASIRDVNFVSATVSSEAVSGDVYMAVVAKEIEGFSAFVTGCTFTACEIKVPSVTGKVFAAMAVAKNQGTVTNCIVNSDCIFTNVNNTACYLGGVVANNALYSGDESAVANCISGIKFSLPELNTSGKFGGIAAVNDALLTNCYSFAQAENAADFGAVSAEDNGNEDNCVYKANDSYYVNGSDNPYTESVYVLAATMSQNAAGYNDTGINYDPPVAVGDYAALWTVKDNDLNLSFDGKTAMIKLQIGNGFYENKEFSSVSIKPVDSTGFEAIKKDSSGNATTFTIMTGSYSSGEYVRNKLKVSISLDKEYVVANNLVLSPVNDSFRQMDNVFLNNGTKYADVFCIAMVNGKNSEFDVDVYPFMAKLEVDTDSSQQTVSAYKFKGEGTAESPFVISNEYELRCLSSHVLNALTYKDKSGNEQSYNKAYYKLSNDITMDSANGTFTPIGQMVDGKDSLFRGSFDGQFHTIYNLVVDNNNDYHGLFGITKGIGDKGNYSQYAVIKNLNVFNAVIGHEEDSDSSIVSVHPNIMGVLAGRAEGTKISGCVTSGKVYGGTQLGGLVGYSYYCDINSCGTSAEIVAYSSKAWAGGFSGYLEHSEVKNCYAAGEVSVSSELDTKYIQVGGFTGQIIDAELEYNYYYNSTEGLWDENVRGISFKESSYLKSDAYLKELINRSECYGTDSGWTKDENNNNNGYPITASVDKKYYAVNCIGTNKGTLTADKSMARQGETVEVTSDSDGLIKIIITDMNKNQLEEIAVSDGIKQLSFEMKYNSSIRVVPVYSGDYLEGRGTEESPYIIYTYEDLVLMSQLINSGEGEYRPEISKTLYYNFAHYIVANAIDCDGKSLTSIGADEGFYGCFDGQGYPISNLKISGEALFTKTFEATVKNLVLNNAEVNGSSAALLSGSVANSVFENIIIKNCSVTGQHSASLVFYEIGQNVTVNNCLFENNNVSSSVGSAVIANVVQTSTVLELCNTVVADISGVDSGYFYDDMSSFGKITSQNNYYEEALKVDDSSYFNVTSVSKDTLSEKGFIGELSYYSENNDLNLWGQDDTDRLTISYNGVPAPVSKILYDEIFTNSDYREIIVVSSINPAYTAGEIVNIKCNSKMSTTNIRIMSGGKNLFYTENIDSSSGDYRIISFIMPAASVYIDNNGEIPTQSSLLGKGTAEAPYLIYDKYDLMLMASVINNAISITIPDGNVEYYKACFKVVGDVDITGINWTPIGVGGYSFEGTFDGNGKSITGLTYAPLFNVISSGAVVTNTVFASPNFENPTLRYGNMGVIAVRNDGSISKCIVKGGVLCADKVNIGGFVGTTSGKIEKCAVIETEFKYVGIYDISLFAHKIEGHTRIILKSYAYNCKFADVRSEPYYSESANGTMNDCYFYVWSDKSGTFYGITEKEKFNSGEVAYLLNRKVTDGSQAWYQNIDNGLTPDDYPVLVSNDINTVYCQAIFQTVYTNNPNKDIFDKDSEGNFIIRTYEDLVNMRILVNKGEKLYVDASYIIVEDITCPEGSLWDAYIGTLANPFKGTLDGQGHTIDGLKMNSTNSVYGGLFGYIKNGAVIKNVHLTNVKADMMNIGYDSVYFGVVCGYSNGGTITGCSVQGNLNLSNIEYAGGICGKNAGGVIENCTTDGQLSYVFKSIKIHENTTYISGISNGIGTILNCANRMDIIVTHEKENKCFIGGISADISKATNCYNYGVISADGSKYTYNYTYNISREVENSYYLSGKSTSDGGKTEAQFKSGEVAYLLNSGVTDGTQCWYQNLDNGEPMDLYPAFTGGTVYNNICCEGEISEYSNTYKEEIPHDYNQFNVCKRCRGLYPGKISGIYGFDIALGGNIGVYYYMVLDEKVLSDPEAKLRFMVPNTGKTTTVEYLVSEAEIYDGLYVFKCEVAAKEMTSQIACQIITENMTEGESDVFYYTVKEYANQLLANKDEFSDEAKLIKAMLNYGAYAQLHFNYRTDDLANTSRYISEADKVLQDVDLSGYEHTYYGSEQGVKWYSTSLLLKSETTIRHYFSLDSTVDLENLEITVNNQPVAYGYKNDYYTVEVKGIPAHKLGENFVVRVGGFTLNYSVFSYGNQVLNSESGESLKNVVRALYEYNQAAIAYKEAE